MQPVENQNKMREGTHADDVGTNLADSGGMAIGAWEFDADNMAYALVAGVAETEGLEPETLEEARKRPDGRSGKKRLTPNSRV